jgi:chromosome segregation ATPase
VLRSTSGDEKYRRKLEAIPENSIGEAPGRDLMRSLLDEIRAMEGQLLQSCRHLDVGAKRIEDLQLQAGSLQSEVWKLQNALDKALIQNQVLSSERDSASRALLEAESLLNDATGQRRQLESELQKIASSLSALELAYDVVVDERRNETSVARRAESETLAWVDECETLLGDIDSLRAELEAERRVRDDHARQLADACARSGYLETELLAERGLRQDLTSALESTAQAVRSHEKRIARLAGSRSRLARERDSLQSAVSELRAHISQDLQPKLAHAEERIAWLNAENEQKAREVGEKDERVQELTAKIANERGNQDQLIAALHAAEQAAQAVEIRLETLVAERTAIASERDALRGEVTESRLVLFEAKKQAQNLRDQIAERDSRILQMSMETAQLSDAQNMAEEQATRLQALLQAEAQSNADLIAALQAAEQAARAAESRISTLASNVAETSVERERLRNQVTELQSMLEATQDRCVALVAHEEEGRRTLADLQAEFQAVCAEREQLKVKVTQLRQDLQDERQSGGDLISALQAAEQSARATGERIMELDARYRAAQQALAVSNNRSMILERRVLELESHIGESEQYVGNLLAQIEAKTVQIVEGSAYAKHLEEKIRMQERVAETLRFELESLKTANLAEKAVTRDYINSLKAEAANVQALREIERLFMAQTEELIHSVQVEGQSIATLIDTVQTSHFWKLKRALRRILNRIRFR